MNETYRLLTIDDEPAIRRSVRSFFEDSGYSVFEAGDGSAGLAAFRAHRPDVILVDLRMPGMDGLQVIQTVTAEAPEVPIVVLSGTGVIADAIAAIRQGAWDYVTKPILEMAHLDHVVRNVLERARLRRLERTHKELLEQEVALRTSELLELNARLKAIVESTRSVAASPGLLAAGERALEEFALNMAADGGSLYLQINGRLQLVRAIDPGHAPQTIALPVAPTSFFGTAIAARKAVLVGNAGGGDETRPSGWGGYRDGSLLVFPLLGKSEELIGLIALHNKKQPPFTEQDLEIGMILASHSCEAIQVALVTEELRESNALLQGVFDLSPHTIALTDMEGRFVAANRTLLHDLGRTLDEVKGRHYSDFLQVEESPGGTGPWLLRDNQEMTTRNRETDQQQTILLSCRALEHNGQQLVLNVAVDVTEQKRIERDLEHAREFTNAIIDCAPGVFFVLNDEGRFIRWNAESENISGYSGDEIANMAPTDFVAEEERARVSAQILEAFRTGKAEALVTYLAKDGKRIPFYFAGSSRVIDGRAYLVAFGMDVSERKSLEHQLLQSQKMEAVGTLAGGVAHDFNNLLQAINGYSGMVLENMDRSSAQWDSINQVVKAGERASRLVSQLLTFSRRNASEPADLDLNEVVSEILKMVRRVIGENIVVEFAPSEIGNICADRNMLEQIILNLCVNSRDAMPDGGKLTIGTTDEEIDAERCDQGAAPGRFVGLNVTDNGCGMSDSTVRRAFEPFFTTKEGRGTGLGLATTFGIVQQHRGFIRVESALGRGTTFRVFFPFRQKGEAANQTIDSGAVVGGNETILVAEDEDFVRDLIRELLQDAGYRVVAVRDGNEALSAFESQPDFFDLLLFDMIMPTLTGPQAAGLVWRRRPSLPVLFATGYDRETVMPPGKAETEYWVLRKPFRRVELLRMVRKAIDAGKSC